jgi:hypothetical protein
LQWAILINTARIMSEYRNANNKIHGTYIKIVQYCVHCTGSGPCSEADYFSPHHTYLRLILISWSLLCLSLPRGLFLSCLNSVYFFHLSNMCNVSCPSHPPTLAQSNSVWWCLLVMK